MRTVLHYLRRIVIVLIKAILTFIPKDNNLILFSAWFGRKYADSSMYVYEFFVKNGYYKPYWYTRNKIIYTDLKSRGMPVLYSKSFKAIWFQIRARVLVTAIQTDDFNQYFYRKCICIDLDHGFVIKQVGFKIPSISKRYIEFRHLLWWGMDFWLSAPTEYNRKNIEDSYCVESSQIIKCNKPRTDALFDPELQKGKNRVVDKIKNGRKAIVWMPTHRSSGKKEMCIEQLLDLDAIQTICETHNVVFIIKKHFYHRGESSDLGRYPNIYDITNEELDSQVILVQADVLISDYSASYIEYLILDRPILLYAFDKEDYMEKERGLYIPFDKNRVGEIVENKKALTKSLERICNDWYDASYAEGRKHAQELYFDKTVKPGEYRMQFKQIVDQLILGNYKPKWDE